MTSLGQLSIVLHAHLPFIRHLHEEDVLEEGWLREAILDTYVPLLWVLEDRAARNLPYRLTLSLSPTLVAMLNDDLLRSRFLRHLDRLCDLTEREVRRTRHLPQFHDVALFYRDRFQRIRNDYTHRWQQDLVGAFRRLSDDGYLELITCAATHGYLPLMQQNPLAVRAQILVAAQHHEATLGSAPLGLWLPECGYYPGLEEVLREASIRYSFVETHGIDHAAGQVQHGVYAPVYCPNGVAMFGRDPESTKQVWSSEEGYPGDPLYREYYRDAGFDLDLEALGSCAHPAGIRHNVGIKYHRVTGRDEGKQPYDRERALWRAAVHARDFVSKRRRQVQHLATNMDHPPIVVAPYDAELFGHWWFEGPQWLGHVLRHATEDPATLSLVTPSQYLAASPTHQVETPASSSWGYKGYSEMWLNGKNDWIYPHLHEAADQMVDLAHLSTSPAPLERRALNQAGRELLLAQASDWAFIMSQDTVVPYAVRRTKEHLGRFHRLARMLRERAIDPETLSAIEELDDIFPHLDYRVYRDDFERQRFSDLPPPKPSRAAAPS